MKYLSIISLSCFALVSCAHQTTKSTVMFYKKPYGTTAWSYLSTKPAKYRTPASAKNVKGLKELMTAIHSNPSYLTPPVGTKIEKVVTFVSDGQVHKMPSSDVYLAGNRSGYFALTTEENEKRFELQDQLQAIELENHLVQIDVKAIKKITATKFVVKYDQKIGDKNGTCEMEIDVKKSSQFQGFDCKNASGETLFNYSIIKSAAINPKDYSKELKSVKLIVVPSALDCSEAQEQEQCFDEVTDGEERDWSYILK